MRGASDETKVSANLNGRERRSVEQSSQQNEPRELVRDVRFKFVRKLQTDTDMKKIKYENEITPTTKNATMNKSDEKIP